MYTTHAEFYQLQRTHVSYITRLREATTALNGGRK